MSLDRELLLQLAVAEDLDAHVAALHQTGGAQRGFVDGAAGVEALEIRDVERDSDGRKRHAEAALGQATLDRSLAALEVRLAEVAAVALLLTLGALAAGLAQARTNTTTQTLLRLDRTGGWSKV